MFFEKYKLPNIRKKSINHLSSSEFTMKPTITVTASPDQSANQNDLPTTLWKNNNNNQKKKTKKVEEESNSSYLSPDPNKSSTTSNEVDPFHHRLSIGLCGILKIFLLSLTLAPLRLMCIIILLAFGSLVAKIGLLGVSDADSQKRPFGGWRRILQIVVMKIARAMFFCMGFHKIVISGKQVRFSFNYRSNKTKIVFSYGTHEHK
jgi:hypothetical protein